MMENTTPFVSILMTAYNREMYIAAAIESVLLSDYTNFELIIVDDRSTDSTVNIARSFEAKDARIKVHINEVNLGDYPNRNRAASLAKGKYIKYLDSDDLIYKHSLSIMVEAMEKFPEVAYAFCSGAAQDDNSPFPVLYSPEQAYFENFFNGGIFGSGPGGTIILKSAFDAVNGFSGIRMVGDYELWLAFSAKFKILKIQPGLIWWRVHQGQEFFIGNKTNIYLKLKHGITVKALEDVNCPLPEKLRKKAIQNSKNLLARAILRIFVHGNFRAAHEVLKSTSLTYADLLISLIPVNKLRKLAGKA
jgi:glycosyltransferase involved in cell wall biosynthesis